MTGCLRDIIFEVSSNKLLTPENMRLTGSAQIAEHKLHGRAALGEFTGADSEKLSFNIRLMESLNVDVKSTIERIQECTARGEPLPLVLGTRAIGRYRWQIKSYNVTYEAFDRLGNPIDATVSLSLVEYLRN